MHEEHFEVEGWPNCIVPDCPFKSYWPAEQCHPHLTGQPLSQKDANTVTREWAKNNA